MHTTLAGMFIVGESQIIAGVSNFGDAAAHVPQFAYTHVSYSSRSHHIHAASNMRKKEKRQKKIPPAPTTSTSDITLRQKLPCTAATPYSKFNNILPPPNGT